MRSLSTSTKIYFGLILVLLLMRVILAFLPLDFIVPSQEVLFTWPAITMVTLSGLVGLKLAQRTGFPEIWDSRISNKQRLLIPSLLGLGAGIVLVLIERVQPLGEVNVPFPVSIPFYVSGSIVSEILLRLFLIPLPIWLISSVLLKGRWQEPAFWGVATLLSLLEPLGQVGALLQIGTLNGKMQALIGLIVVVVYGTNLISAYLFRKSGFAAPLIARLSLYLVWHTIV